LKAERGASKGLLVLYISQAGGRNNSHWQGGENDISNGSASEDFLKPYYESIENLSIQDIPSGTPSSCHVVAFGYAAPNCFAYESFMDELAVDAGKDTLDFSTQYLKEERLQFLIDKMEEVSGWKSLGSK
jgi:isoquinoline 1-oxidoreductase beta subunit